MYKVVIERPNKGGDQQDGAEPLPTPEPQPEQLDADVERVMAMINAGSEGDLEKRVRLAVKARTKPEFLQALDEALDRAWEKSNKSLWDWDCLTFTGAMLAKERTPKAQVRDSGKRESVNRAAYLHAGNGPGPRPRPQPPRGGGCGLRCRVESGGSGSPGMVIPLERGQRLNPNLKAKVQALEQVISTVRKEIGWLEAELAFTRSKRKRAKGKAARRRGKIRRRFGLQSSQLNTRRLRVLLERQRSLLRVKVLQQRRATKLEKRRRQRTNFGAQGPKCLKEGVRVQAPQARETTHFWCEIWARETPPTAHSLTGRSGQRNKQGRM